MQVLNQVKVHCQSLRAAATSTNDFLQMVYLVTYLVSDAPKDLENGASGTKEVTKAEAGTAEYLIELEERRSIKVNPFFRNNFFAENKNMVVSCPGLI